MAAIAPEEDTYRSQVQPRESTSIHNRRNVADTTAGVSEGPGPARRRRDGRPAAAGMRHRGEENIADTKVLLHFNGET